MHRVCIEAGSLVDGIRHRHQTPHLLEAKWARPISSGNKANSGVRDVLVTYGMDTTYGTDMLTHGWEQ